MWRCCGHGTSIARPLYPLSSVFISSHQWRQRRFLSVNWGVLLHFWFFVASFFSRKISHWIAPSVTKEPPPKTTSTVAKGYRHYSILPWQPQQTPGIIIIITTATHSLTPVPSIPAARHSFPRGERRITQSFRHPPSARRSPPLRPSAIDRRCIRPSSKAEMT